MWDVWSFDADVMEDTPPKTVLGTHAQALEVSDPEADQIIYAIESVECGGGSCDWFLIGSCDGKLRVKAGAAIKYTVGLSVITLSITATDSSGLKAAFDAAGKSRASATIRVTVLNKAEPPTIAGPSSFTIAENIQGCQVNPPPSNCRLGSITPNTAFGSIVASDPDGSVLTYFTKNINDPNFYVQQVSGDVYIRKAFNSENLHGLVLVVKGEV